MKAYDEFKQGNEIFKVEDREVDSIVTEQAKRTTIWCREQWA